MKKIILFFLLTSSICYAQNFVLNGDFEAYYNCPTNISQLDSAKFWVTPTNGTSDYFNQCNLSYVNVPNTQIGYQQAYNGVAYAGICLWTYGYSSTYREYLEVALSASLSSGVTYYFQMKFNLANVCIANTDQLGVYFSDTIVDGVPNNLNLPFLPQITNVAGNFPDSLNWSSISGSYTASGGEDFLIIGNFKNNTNTNPSVINVTDSLTATPVYVFIDDVYLGVTPQEVGVGEQNHETQISIYPNPTNGSFSIFTSQQIINGSIEIHNVIGELVFSQKIINQQNTIDLKNQASGLYFVKVISDGEVIGMKKVVTE